MSQKIAPGTYRAKVVNFALSENKKGDPQVEVLFDFAVGDGLETTHHQIRWWGQLSEKAAPYTLKNLVTLGYLGTTNEDFARLADGVESGLVDLSREVDLVIEYETNPDGKSFPKIKWINSPGGGFKSGMTREQAKVKLGALNLAGQLALARQEMGAPHKPQAPKQAPAKASPGPSQTTVNREPGADDDFLDDLPF